MLESATCLILLFCNALHGFEKGAMIGNGMLRILCKMPCALFVDLAQYEINALFCSYANFTPAAGYSSAFLPWSISLRSHNIETRSSLGPET